MEKYKKSLMLQNICFILGALCLTAVQVLAFLRVFKPATGDSHWANMYAGFIAGASLAVTAIFVFGLIRNLLAMQNEEKLRKLYAKEHDERNIQIGYNAQSGAYRLCLIAMIVAIIVAGYFSATVSLTCLVVTLVQSLVGVAFKLYWAHRL